MKIEQKKKIIDYYFTEPNSKAVLEDEDIGVTREEVTAFLKEVYGLLVNWVNHVPYHPGVTAGKSATTADLERMARERAN